MGSPLPPSPEHELPASCRPQRPRHGPAARRHVYDKAPSLLREHQEATLELQQQSLRRAAARSNSRRAAAKWVGAKPQGRKSLDVARAEWESHVSGRPGPGEG